MPRFLRLLLIGALAAPSPALARTPSVAIPHVVFDNQALSVIALNNRRPLFARARVPVTTYALAVVAVGIALSHASVARAQSVPAARQEPQQSEINQILDQIAKRPPPQNVTLDALRETLAGLPAEERVILFRSYRIVGPQWILKEIEIRIGREGKESDFSVALPEMPPIPGKPSFNPDESFSTDNVAAGDLATVLAHPDTLPSYVAPPRPLARLPMPLFPDLGPARLPIATRDHPFGRLIWESIDRVDVPTLRVKDPSQGGTVTLLLLGGALNQPHPANTALQRQLETDFTAMLTPKNTGGWPVYFFFGEGTGLGVFNAATTEMVAIQRPDGSIRYGVAVYFNEDRLRRFSPSSRPYSRADARVVLDHEKGHLLQVFDQAQKILDKADRIEAYLKKRGVSVPERARLEDALNYTLSALDEVQAIDQQSPAILAAAGEEIRQSQAQYRVDKNAAYRRGLAGIVDGWFGNSEDDTAQRGADIRWLDALLHDPLPSVTSPDYVAPKTRHRRGFFFWLVGLFGVVPAAVLQRGGFAFRRYRRRVPGGLVRYAVTWTGTVGVMAALAGLCIVAIRASSTPLTLDLSGWRLATLRFIGWAYSLQGFALGSAVFAFRHPREKFRRGEWRKTPPNVLLLAGAAVSLFLGLGNAFLWGHVGTGETYQAFALQMAVASTVLYYVAAAGFLQTDRGRSLATVRTLLGWLSAPLAAIPFLWTNTLFHEFGHWGVFQLVDQLPGGTVVVAWMRGYFENPIGDDTPTAFARALHLTGVMGFLVTVAGSFANWAVMFLLTMGGVLNRRHAALRRFFLLAGALVGFRGVLYMFTTLESPNKPSDWAILWGSGSLWITVSVVAVGLLVPLIPVFLYSRYEMRHWLRRAESAIVPFRTRPFSRNA